MNDNPFDNPVLLALIVLCIINALAALAVIAKLAAIEKRTESLENLLISVSSNVSKLPKSGE